MSKKISRDEVFAQRHLESVLSRNGSGQCSRRSNQGLKTYDYRLTDYYQEDNHHNLECRDGTGRTGIYVSISRTVMMSRRNDFELCFDWFHLNETLTNDSGLLTTRRRKGKGTPNTGRSHERGL